MRHADLSGLRIRNIHSHESSIGYVRISDLLNERCAKLTQEHGGSRTTYL